MAFRTPTSRRHFLCGAATAACLAPAGARSGEDGALLVVSGLVRAVDGATVSFSADELRALDWREIVTHTAWTQGPQRFAGPTLASVLEAVGAAGERLDAVALNDYRVEIPLRDAELGVILAMERAGERLRVRDKGPIWLLYPQTEAEAAIGAHNERMIWQLREIVIR